MSYIHSRNQTIIALRIAKDTKSFKTFRAILQFQDYVFNKSYVVNGVRYVRFHVDFTT